jgi:hypothetical protein
MFTSPQNFAPDIRPHVPSLVSARTRDYVTSANSTGGLAGNGQLWDTKRLMISLPEIG